jgi:repressor LexA
MARTRAAKGLSARQHGILDFIGRFIEQNGRPPTFREIGDATGIRSTSVVDYNLKVLEREMLIRRDSKVSRGIELLTESGELRQQRLVSVPISGRIAAGQPIEALPGHPETIPLPLELGSDSAYALRVKGKSMIEDLIDDGDLVVVRPQQTADNGDIVVALLTDGPTGEGSATLKRFYRERDRVRLQPANSAMDPIYVRLEHLQVQGKVIAVIRQLS